MSQDVMRDRTPSILRELGFRHVSIPADEEAMIDWALDNGLDGVKRTQTVPLYPPLKRLVVITGEFDSFFFATTEDGKVYVLTPEDARKLSSLSPKTEVLRRFRRYNAEKYMELGTIEPLGAGADPRTILTQIHIPDWADGVLVRVLPAHIWSTDENKRYTVRVTPVKTSKFEKGAYYTKLSWREYGLGADQTKALFQLIPALLPHDFVVVRRLAFDGGFVAEDGYDIYEADPLSIKTRGQYETVKILEPALLRL